MSRLRTLAIVLALATAAFAQTATQAPPEPTYGQHFLLQEDFVKPAMAQQYEALAKEYIALLKQNNVTFWNFTGITIQGQDFVYTTVTPFENWAQWDQNMANMKAVTAKFGPAKMADFDRRYGQAVDHSASAIVREMPDWSYKPANMPPMNPADMTYSHYDIYYLMPGHDDDVNRVGRDYKALFQRKNIPMGYEIYMVTMGHDLPALVVVQHAKDAADYHAKAMQIDQALGAEGQALAARALAITRRLESREGHLRMDLSYMPNMAVAPPTR